MKMVKPEHENITAEEQLTANLITAEARSKFKELDFPSESQ